MSEVWQQTAANYLHCSLLSIPFVYLGMPIGANPRKCQLWDPIINKCERKLAKWKQRHISFGGRATLIKSVLTSIPIYFFSFFRVPRRVVDKLVCIQRRFLWGGEIDHNKIVWVNWETVCLPKERGGLGIKDITKFNSTLLGKWKWDLFHRPRELWAKVLVSKYRGWRGLAEASSDNNVSIWWRDLKLALHHPSLQNVLRDGIIWKVGSGDKIKFWEDSWLDGEIALLARYPRLYLNSCQQNHRIKDMGMQTDMGWEWNFK